MSIMTLKLFNLSFKIIPYVDTITNLLKIRSIKLLQLMRRPFSL